MDCVGVDWMMRSINRSHHQFGTCSHSNMLLGLLGSVFHSEKRYYDMYNVYTYNYIFYMRLSRQEWVDGVGQIQMSTSQLGKYLVGLRFTAGLSFS